MAICSLSMLSRIAWQICAHAMCASIELALFDEGGWTSSSCANPADAHRARCIKSGMRCNPGLRATCSRCCNRARSISSFSIACNILLRLSSRYSFCSSRSLMATCNEWQLSDWQEETGDELRLLVSRMQRNTYASCLPKFGADSLIGRHFLEVLQPVHQGEGCGLQQSTISPSSDTCISSHDSMASENRPHQQDMPPGCASP